ncbi:unnamed protein product [Paramecium sonneborni]|uniref:Uncharacterized protein n=1 Tax=Paramecium sonneborni TaxID=65129 RepID=A0A8S1KY82_9CILI|nr:unnamed protein product [Paramecium sonneborni]
MRCKKLMKVRIKEEGENRIENKRIMMGLDGIMY